MAALLAAVAHHLRAAVRHLVPAKQSTSEDVKPNGTETKPIHTKPYPEPWGSVKIGSEEWCGV